jgi:hypothetical protein
VSCPFTHDGQLYKVFASQLFEKSAQLSPENAPGKWLYLAQLQEGWSALQSFTRGVDLLKAELVAKEVSAVVVRRRNRRSWRYPNLRMICCFRARSRASPRPRPWSSGTRSAARCVAWRNCI